MIQLHEFGLRMLLQMRWPTYAVEPRCESKCALAHGRWPYMLNGNAVHATATAPRLMSSAHHGGAPINRKHGWWGLSRFSTCTSQQQETAVYKLAGIIH